MAKKCTIEILISCFNGSILKRKQMLYGNLDRPTADFTLWQRGSNGFVEHGDQNTVGAYIIQHYGLKNETFLNWDSKSSSDSESQIMQIVLRLYHIC